MNIWKIIKELEAAYINHSQDKNPYEHEKFIKKSEIVECEDCGCLLYRNKKFKRDSTIEKYIEELKYSSNGYRYFAQILVTEIPENYKGEVKEKLVEHYRCNRCETERLK